jgi:hypothetical protein
MILILEDEAIRHNWFNKKFPGCTITDNPNEMVKLLVAHQHDVKQVFLDHDLNFYEYTPYKSEVNGMHVVQAMVRLNICKDIPVIIHSMSGGPAERMFNYLVDNGYTRIRYRPYNDLLRMVK